MSKSTIKTSIYSLAGAATLLGTRVLAASPQDTAQNAVDSITPSGTSTDLTSLLQLIINSLIGIVGVAAVIMLIIGGFRYVFSQGNEKSVNAAKDTILYAIIGIVVAILAFAIVNFVIAGLS